MGIADGLKRGTIEIILLSLLSQRDMYGYDICRSIEETSNGLYVITEGSLYPVLYRMLEKGYITDRSEKVGKRRTRVYYHIEQSGINYLEEIKGEYFSLHNGIVSILNSTVEDQQK